MSDLDKIIRAEEDNLANTFNTLVGFPMTISGEAMQFAAVNDLMEYNWATGHLSDFGIVFQTSAIAYQLTSRFNNCVQVAASLIPPIVCTIHEYYPLFNGERVTDHADTALFWLGWTASIGGIKYLASRKANKLLAQRRETTAKY